MNVSDRTAIDCRDFPNEIGCTLRITGNADEVVKAAREHAVSAHGHHDSDELAQMLRGALRPDAIA